MLQIDAIALLVITVSSVAILFGLHRIVTALYDFGEDFDAEWQRRQNDVDWWGL